MTTTLNVGRVRLVEVADGELTIQVASGMDTEGQLFVLLRVGQLAAIMSPEGAERMARALQAEVALVQLGGKA